jgi:hypothetical protein
MLTPARELEGWSMLFKTGHDFFDDLLDIGVFHEHARNPPRDVIADAWCRLGNKFLENWQPDAHREKPWALEELGEPKA